MLSLSVFQLAASLAIVGIGIVLAFFVGLITGREGSE